MRTAQANSPTKDKLLDAAYDLMLMKGYVGTTVDEICEKAKVTKGSFFHYFESKEELAKCLLQRLCERSENFRDVDSSHKDPLNRVYDYVDFAIKTSKDPRSSRGCLLGTLAQELSDIYPEIRKICCAGFNKMTEKFAKDIDAAKKEYSPSAKFTGKSLAEHFISVLEGSLILAKVHKDMKIVEENLRHFKQYLRSLFGK